MKYWVLCLFGLVAAAAGGCATFEPTPYQPSVDGGYGYSEERTGPGEYRITVSGNAATSAQTLWDQLLRRAAEIARDSGRDYFAVAPTATGQLATIKPAFLMPQFGTGPAAGLGVRTPIIRYYGRNYGPGVDYAYPVGVEPSRELIISATVTLTDRRRSDASNVFDAHTLRRLTPMPGVIPPPE